MTDLQKSQIENYRLQGYGYKKIGQLMGLSANTVKTHCKRNSLSGTATPQGTHVSKKNCKYCGKPLAQTPGHKPRIFCSDACRTKWWNANTTLLHHRNGREISCGHCGETFSVSQNSTRKYCSHECYIADRFHGGDLR